MVQLYRALLVFLAGFSLASAQEDPDPCLEQDYAVKNHEKCCTYDGYLITTFGPKKAGRGPVCEKATEIVYPPQNRTMEFEL